ncbi:amino acid permease [Thermogymnomonas acidicola]|uniref:amino acid permease n=1 Tax=Thermogymnomonas acidicola TaxID=399579 RepID=UPI0009463B26|nr:amino acid permease [Thermogymnomonas acidicola]
MDGWEIDSYAAEEAIEPKYHPGKTGILGLVMVTCIYLLLMPLILSETPGTLLASSLDPLYTWISTVSPGSEFSVVLAVVLSTATSLWLTAFILSRAWFSLGRDRIFPKAFEKTNRRGAPIIPVLVMMVPVAAIDFAVSLSPPHVFSYFSVLLGFSGLFLTLEFMFDNATCAWVSARNGRRVMAVATGVNAAFLCSLCVYYTVYSGLTSLLILALFIPHCLPHTQGGVRGFRLQHSESHYFTVSLSLSILSLRLG